jgi:hypothetical protein
LRQSPESDLSYPKAIAARLADTLPTLAGRTATVRGCARSQRASRSSPSTTPQRCSSSLNRRWRHSSSRRASPWRGRRLVHSERVGPAGGGRRIRVSRCVGAGARGAGCWALGLNHLRVAAQEGAVWSLWGGTAGGRTGRRPHHGQSATPAPSTTAARRPSSGRNPTTRTRRCSDSSRSGRGGPARAPPPPRAIAPRTPLLPRRATCAELP